MRNLAILGAGGLGREAATWARACQFNEVILVEDDEFHINDFSNGIPILPLSKVNKTKYEWVIAVGNPRLRFEIYLRLKDHCKFTSLIHPSAIIGDGCTLGEGIIICPNSVVTNEVSLGQHSILNISTIVAHGSTIKEFVTCSPNVAIMGNCIIGEMVFLGAASTVREGIQIAPQTIVGMGSIVVRNLSKGTYVGNPARKV